jgi:hypothetical protein
MRATRDTSTARRFIPFLPFLFLGVVFLGHGPLAILLSLLVSVGLTASISFLLLRRRGRARSPAVRDVFISPASSAGLDGVLQLDAAGLHWMPRRPSLPLWFIAWDEVLRTTVRDHGARSQLQVELAGGDTLTLEVEASVEDLERALTHAGVT